MGVTALVMAGGKGSRMALAGEKPLLKVGGKPIIEHVLAALKSAGKVDAVAVAVSDYTPETAKHAAKFGVTVVQTPGKEYVFDMGCAVRALKLRSVLAVAADLPLLTGEIIDDIVTCYERCGKPTLTVAVPISAKAKLGVGVEYAFEVGGERVVPAGINVLDGNLIDEAWLEQEVCVVDKVEVALNVNTVRELGIAEELFQRKRSETR